MVLRPPVREPTQTRDNPVNTRPLMTPHLVGDSPGSLTRLVAAFAQAPGQVHAKLSCGLVAVWYVTLHGGLTLRTLSTCARNRITHANRYLLDLDPFLLNKSATGLQS